MSHPKHVTDCIESICQQGCNHVRDVIDALENSQHVDAISQLHEDEKKTVLHELKNIMAVYDKK
jgi:hypothetical protein